MKHLQNGSAIDAGRSPKTKNGRYKPVVCPYIEISDHYDLKILTLKPNFLAADLRDYFVLFFL